MWIFFFFFLRNKCDGCAMQLIWQKGFELHLDKYLLVWLIFFSGLWKQKFLFRWDKHIYFFVENRSQKKAKCLLSGFSLLVTKILIVWRRPLGFFFSYNILHLSDGTCANSAIPNWGLPWMPKSKHASLPFAHFSNMPLIYANCHLSIFGLILTFWEVSFAKNCQW